eukprot:CAMPEP_0168170662 /NCGR_PEP_ID=MMETSP0139_2-20121125/4302_1 /TAXON_ID=44445 /ORGANISM="Pseudo-nitzschia australis, Strain 10249 10 AB" /LENGTH=936 /DNA_ID=CAMNT_0008088185 /DNA_START=120 /DNA_END=2931 /DNA_ORIENTATION=-
MGPRRRKGKGGSRSSTPTPPSASQNEKGNKNDETDEKAEKNSPKSDDTQTKKTRAVVDEKSLLVLTSEKRRGIYECDYCHSDISQQPRIRCAVCSDFDLCLDCFTTTDHGAMMARIKAANQTQTELNKDGIESSSIVGVAISSAAAHHEDHHCYRVCDSTRYPIFPPGRVAAPPLVPAIKKGTEETNNKEQGTTDEMSSKEKKKPPSTGSKNDARPILSHSNNISVEVLLSDDPKSLWTAEEDLRLIDAIATHGLGNWVDIAEAIGGNGSVGKTPKRCIERYLDDYLGRYGYILPQWTIADDTTEESMNTTAPVCMDTNPKDATQIDGSAKIITFANAGSTQNDTNSKKTGDTGVAAITDSKKDQNQNKAQGTGTEQTPSEESNQSKEGGQETAVELPEKTSTVGTSASILAAKIIVDDDDRVRTSKRRSAAATGNSSFRKKLKVFPTESFPGYEKIWPKPYLPTTSGAVMGKEVARDQSYKAELAFVKASLAAPSKEEADKIRQTWIDTKLGRIGAPTVLPPRSHDVVHLLGSELAGFMPRRGDFDVEWENEAETALADMEFIRGDKPEDKELKLKVLQIYCEKLDEREKRKKFVLNRHLYDYRTYVQNDLKLPADERDLVHRMRLFERFHAPDEHTQFINDILKAKRLRKEIAKLQMYRRMGIRSLAEVEMYELDKDRRQFHKKLEIDAKAKAAAIANPKGSVKGGGTTPNASTSSTSRTPIQFKGTGSLWKTYRVNDRQKRRNSGRSGSLIEGTPSKTSDHKTAPNGDRANEGENNEDRHVENMVNKEGKGISINLDKTAEEVTIEKESRIEKDKADVTTERDDPMEMDVAEKTNFDLSSARCRDLLTRKELNLCERHQIYPAQYLEIKKALIHESLENGLLNKDSSNSNKRTIVKIDVERRGNIVEFLIRAGWINRKLGDAALRVVTPRPAS